MVAAQMVAMGELLVLAQKAGADPEKVVDAIKGGAAACWTLDNKPQRLFAGNRTPGFKAAMQYKDLNIVMEMAKTYGVPLPGTATNTQLFNALVVQRSGRSGQFGGDWRDRTIGADHFEDERVNSTHQFTRRDSRGGHMSSLAGQVAVVTGGARGIGRGIAHRAGEARRESHRQLQQQRRHGQ